MDAVNAYQVPDLFLGFVLGSSSFTCAIEIGSLDRLLGEGQSQRPGGVREGQLSFLTPQHLPRSFPFWGGGPCRPRFATLWAVNVKMPHLLQPNGGVIVQGVEEWTAL
jgi:hypothetical protein